jgi:F-type H+-transporting ATPase subunit b
MRRRLATAYSWAVVFFLAILLPSAVFASGGEEGNLISFDWSLIVQGVNFLLLIVLLTKLLYRPLLAKMNERTQAIQKSLDEAQQARAEAQKEREEFASKIQAAHAEAQGIRAAALKDAADEQRRLVEAARAEAGRLVASARQEMEQDVRRARQELRQEVADLAISVSERLIRKSLNDADHRRVVDDAIARMGQKN